MCNNEGITEITIEELAEDIEELIWNQGVNCFKITESIEKRDKCTYLLRDLHIEIEDEFVISWDSDNIIQHNMYVIMMFLKESIKYINRIAINGIQHSKLYCKEGYVLIEPLDFQKII